MGTGSGYVAVNGRGMTDMARDGDDETMPASCVDGCSPEVLEVDDRRGGLSTGWGAAWQLRRRPGDLRRMTRLRWPRTRVNALAGGNNSQIKTAGQSLLP